ncbi:MAG: phosphoadenosine phosphosulfate reductase, partial [Novosphingobium sp.]|nr:phosphoadenosine phosphosulfate reductase [Novosphingobium sp.]
MAEAVRRIDRIDTAARFTAEDAAALHARFADASAEDVLRAVLVDGVAGRVALVSSFGAESSVLLHLA